MGVEIEHKFLVRDSSWRSQVTRTCEILQGYFRKNTDYALRVRIVDDRQALLTLKGYTQSITRKEFEYMIPVEEGRQLIRDFCGDRIIRKRRHYIDAPPYVWEIDEYFDRLQGFYTAEIELPSEDADFARPSWLGRDVSREPGYSNEELANGSRVFANPENKASDEQ